MVEKNDIYNRCTKSKTDDVLTLFNSTIEGLTKDQIEISRKKYGSNKIAYSSIESISKKIIKSFLTPFTIVLLILASVSFFTNYVLVESSQKSIMSVVIILVMILLSGGVSFIQSVRSSNAAAKLKSMLKSTISITRKDNNNLEINIDDIVCGDIVNLKHGDIIPADIRLLETKDLLIGQSTLTGESEAVEKNAETISDNLDIENIIEYKNIVFMGSSVNQGHGKGIVIATGANSQFGEIARGITHIDSHTNFEKGINSVSWLLIRFMLIMVPIVFLINGISKGNWMDAGLFALSIGIGLTPEMLPMAVTANLVKGTMTMAKEGTIIKNINSIQDFGALDVLCTDKTGTLTDDKIILEHYIDVNGNIDNNILKLAYLNSFYQSGLQNSMDLSVLEKGDENKISIEGIKKIEELPFDFERRKMSVVVNENNNYTIITKGAIEEVLQSCTQINNNKKIINLDDEQKTNTLKIVNNLNANGYRVIAIATKIITKTKEYTINDEAQLILQGYLAFQDPPKKSAVRAIKSIKNDGVILKVLTGDNELITKTVCKKVGINVDKIAFGYQIDQLNPEELNKLTKEVNVFVKLTPQQKEKIVNSLRENNHTVGYMGDGINDALAIKKADVGISVDTAADITKDAADIILLKKDLKVLNTGIISGRRIFSNINKYIKITASSNFGNMVSVLIASIFLPFLPMLPIQILILNLIYDLSSTSMPWDNVDREYLSKPRKWDSKLIEIFMLRIGPVSSIFDIMTYLLMYFIICPAVFNGPFHTLDSASKIGFIALFNAGWFVESLWSQTLVIHTLRTDKIPFLQSRASNIVTIVTTFGIIIGTILPFTDLGTSLGMVALPAIYFAYLILIIILYMIVVSIAKRLYVKKYK